MPIWISLQKNVIIRSYQNKMTKTLYLLRHCSTKDSELGINGSRTDTPLSEKGLLQARELANILLNYQFDLLIVSPLQRTLQTIEPYLNTLKEKPEVVVDPLTLERDLGLLTNSVNSDGKIPESIVASGKPKTEWIPPDGESTLQVYNRAKKFLEKVKKRQENKILICGHQNFLRCLELVIRKILLSDENFYSGEPPRLEFGELRKYRL